MAHLSLHLRQLSLKSYALAGCFVSIQLKAFDNGLSPHERLSEDMHLLTFLTIVCVEALYDRRILLDLSDQVHVDCL